MFSFEFSSRSRCAPVVALIAGIALTAPAGAQSVQELTGHTSMFEDELGGAVDVHGEWAVIGARDGAVDGDGVVQVYRFDQHSMTWAFVQEITSTSPLASDFGAAVAMGDGVLLVGAPRTDAGAFDEVGTVEVFRLSMAGSSWVSAGFIESPVQQSDAMFGMRLAYNGSALAVAMTGSTVPFVAPRVYVYRHQGDGLFSGPETITPPGGIDAAEKFADDIDVIDLEMDDDLVIVGAPKAFTLGRAYIYRNTTGTTWSLIQTLSTSTGGSFADFGTAVALTPGYAFVGSPLANLGAGAVEVYDESAAWGLSHDFPPMGVDPGLRFGTSIDAENQVVVVGAPGNPSGQNEFGQVWTIVDPDGMGSWTFDLADPIIATTPTNGDYFGAAVATNMLNAMVGAPTNETVGGEGKAYAVRLDAPFPDCNMNGIPDALENFADCNLNEIPDVCEGIVFDVFGYASGSPMGDETRGGVTLTFMGSNFPSGEQGMQVFFEYDGYRVEVPAEDIVSMADPDPPMDECVFLDVVVPAFPPPCDCGSPGFNSFPADIIFYYDEPSLGVVREVRLSDLPGMMDFTYTITKSIVPPDTSIQPYINNAVPGTCIVLSQDVYTENLTFTDGDNRMTLTSTDIDDPSETRVRGGTSITPALPTIRLSGEISETSVCGINIVLGNSGVVIENGASVTLFKNRVENNFASGAGGGVLVTDGALMLPSEAHVENNIIVLNTSGGEGGGLAVVNSSAMVLDNRFVNNTAGGPGGGLSVNNSDVTIYTNDIISNDASGGGGGINLSPNTEIAVRDNIVNVNGADGDGGGVRLDSDFDIDLSVNEIVGNLGTSDGGGVYIGGMSAAEIRYNLITNNAISSLGGGIYLDGVSEPSVVNNRIDDNEGLFSSSRGGGIFVGGFNISDIHENIIKGNIAQRGGAIAADLKSEPDIFRNVIAFNESEAMPPFPSPPSFAPGILVGDLDVTVGPAPDIIQNTFYMNTHNGGSDTGTVHGLRIGLFEPDWSENIFALGVSGGAMWGIFCEDGPNTGVRMDYNFLQSMVTDAIDPACAIPGAPPFMGNMFGDPMFLDPQGCDFRMLAESDARSNGASGGFSGAVQPDGIALGSLRSIEDTGSETVLDWPSGGTSPNAVEVYIDVKHLSREFATSGGTARARTLFVQLNSFFNDFVGVLPSGNGLQLTVPLRTPGEPGSSLTLFRSVNEEGPFVAFGVPGFVTAGGDMAVFDDIQPAQMGSQAYIFVGAHIGDDCNGNGVNDADEWVDDNNDGIFDVCQSGTCPGDVDGDQVVGFEDVILIVGGLGTKDPGLDVDGDGSITVNDIMHTIPDFGECQPIDPRPINPGPF